MTAPGFLGVTLIAWITQRITKQQSFDFIVKETEEWINDNYNPNGLSTNQYITVI